MTPHFKDPCIYCGTPHDEVEVGDCKGFRASRDHALAFDFALERVARALFDHDNNGLPGFTRYPWEEAYELVHLAYFGRARAAMDADPRTEMERENAKLCAELSACRRALSDIALWPLPPGGMTEADFEKVRERCREAGGFSSGFGASR